MELSFFFCFWLLLKHGVNASKGRIVVIQPLRLMQIISDGCGLLALGSTL